ncbi:TetR/AcrR family transcriptional regulator [Schaalia sp. ZJ405]|uniref:TetR/AcrR family transcriptional regulator n=1 Tax=Schaalia sp. ZJ405 TaxID=2709403 RepID=UPI0013EB00FE|nr:TetR/AcrR family transcriptional regulator [Schaalia sp. ZJ405]QPK81213.1 TetR/AcrR family transcriptional regulator [Schaalia sp. ZJ405]
MPKIIGDNLADHRQMTRRLLFDALGDLLATTPFDAITMSQIANLAGVGRTSVYNHFPDKEILLLAYMREVTAEFTEMLTEALDNEPDALEQMRLYLRAYLELTAKYHVTSGMNLHREISAENASHLADHASIVGRVLLDILTKLIVNGLIPRQNPHTLVTLIHSTLSGQRLPIEPRARDEHIANVQAFILRGIGVAPELVTPASPGDTDEPVASDDTGSPSAFLRCPVHA